MIVVSAKDLTKAYGTDVILDKVSFHINKGDRVGIIGINGAGKTTLLKMLTGELPYEEGEAFISADLQIGYLKQDGIIITNTQQINPMPVIAGTAEYPVDLLSAMRDEGARVDAFDCLKLAQEAGTSKAVNLVLLGRLSNHFDFSMEEWMTQIEASVPAKFVEINKKAFRLGREYGK